MTIVQTKFVPGRYGLGTEFAESETPLEFSRRFTNRFININGDAEKRQGITQLGNDVSGMPTITEIHEYIDNDGNSTLFASADGTIYRYNTTSGDWDSVLTGKDPTNPFISAQMGDKLIFVNGVDRNFFTDDAGDTFSELKALINRGQISTPASATGMDDSNVDDWLSETYVNVNDLVYNSTKGAYGIITSVGASNISHTAIGSAATGLGLADENQVAGDFYQIIDLVSLNVVEQNDGLDNFAIAGTGTSAAGVAVSGVNWLNTDIKEGDYIYNTTRSAVALVSAVATAQLTTTSITGQTANDSVQFFKSAMPIASYVHVHFGRAYYIDARARGTVRISGPDDPQDMTTFKRTIEAGSKQYSTRQPQAERLLSLKTFQKYLVAAGERNVYADTGVNPIADATASTTDFLPVGLFPQGCVSTYGLESIGGSMNFIANDGIRNFTATFDSNTFQTSNVSEANRTEVADAIESKTSDPNEMKLIHYPRRNWLMCKIGDVIYNYNYTPYYFAGQINPNQYGSFSKFTGTFAEQKAYFVRNNGDLLCAGENGKIYLFDQGSYSDDGAGIQTILETGWLRMLPQDSTQVQTGTYIKPTFEASNPVTYTITATGDYSEISTDTITTTAQGVGQVGFAQVGTSPIGGKRIKQDKLPLRWKGEEFKMRFETNDTSGPDIITNYTIYGNVLGKV